jgi:hypothetical protein
MGKAMVDERALQVQTELRNIDTHGWHVLLVSRRPQQLRHAPTAALGHHGDIQSSAMGPRSGQILPSTRSQLPFEGSSGLPEIQLARRQMLPCRDLEWLHPASEPHLGLW